MSIPTNSHDETEQLKKALLTIRRLRGRVDELERARHEPIAIVGIGMRVPGANSVDAFWDLLMQSRDATGNVPDDLPGGRWEVAHYLGDRPNQPGKMATQRGGYMHGVDRFDAEFFGISPREADLMDPQQRLVLMTAWEALEDAGIPPQMLSGTDTGVFLGIGLNDYGRLLAQAQQHDPSLNDTYSVAGTVFCIAPNRLSYLLNLRGPSLAIDTACSSSLVAVHEACQSLRSGESTFALAGGSNVILAPDNSVGLRSFLTHDGLTKFGDARADGFVRGEGVIMVALATLARAQADKLPVYALITGSAVNQDGYSSGLTVPNGVAQQALLKRALREAGVDAASVAYVEAHGTGTQLGDPIEIQALGAVLGGSRSADRPLLIGSVKTNIGHLEAAAGIAGVVKAALVVKHGIIPQSLHYASPNPLIDFDGLHVRVVDGQREWPAAEGPRVAGVSSFGFGGVNAHAILQEPPASPAGGEPVRDAAERSQHLLALSAKDDEALRALAQRYLDHMDSTDTNSQATALADIAYAANAGRSHFSHRLATVAPDLASVRAQLAGYLRGEEVAGIQQGALSRAAAPPSVAFLFTGQGAQYPGMGKGLYDADADFRADIDKCAALLQGELGVDLRDLILRDDPAPRARLDQTQFTQPALFALEYALAQQWMRWGIQPEALLGHSVGEYVAACLAGVFTLEDGLRLIVARARLMQSLPAGGEMASVFAPAVEVERATAHYPDLSVAAYNGPTHTVISGGSASLAMACADFEQRGVRTRRLATSHAFHSPLVEPILDEFERIAATVTYQPPRLPLVSNLHGRMWAAGEVPDAGYWRNHLRSAVRFGEGMQALHAAHCRVFVEIGPAPVLTSMGTHTVPGTGTHWLPSLRQGQDDWQTILGSLAQLYVLGAEIDWRAFDRPWPRHHVSVPKYPFRSERYWFDRDTAVQRGRALDGSVQLSNATHGSFQSPASALTPLIDRRVLSPLLDVDVVETTLAASTRPWLADHRAFGMAIFPAAGYLQLLFEAAQVCGLGAVRIEELVIQAPLPIPAETQVMLQCTLAPEAENLWQALLHAAILEDSEAKPVWTLHVTARLRAEAAPAPQPGAPASAQDAAGSEPLTAIQQRMGEPLAVAAIHAALRAVGMEYRGAFRGVQRVWSADREALAQLAQAEAAPGAGAVPTAPLLDTMLQPIAAITLDGALYLPFSLEGATLGAWRPGALWSHVRLTKGAPGDDTLECAVQVYHDSGAPVFTIERLVFKRATRAAMQAAARTPHMQDDAFFVPQWTLLPARQPETASSAEVVILATDDADGKRLHQLATAIGARAQLLNVGAPAGAESDGSASHMLDAGQIRDALSNVAATDAEIRVLLYFGDTDARSSSASDLPQRTHEQLALALHVLQALAHFPRARLWVGTSGATSVDGEGIARPDLGALTGLARVALREAPELRCICVDVDAPAADASLRRLLLETLAQTPDAESELALRGDRRYALRLRKVRPESTASSGVHTDAAELPRRLSVGAQPGIDQLQFAPIPMPVPQAHEIVIEVRAAGLNFRDVLNALDLYPGDDHTLGNECAGVVVAVGAQVQRWQVGDEVIALAAGSLATHAVAPAALCVAKPAQLTWSEAAALPIAYLTAHFGLITLANLRAGQRVLIHAAAGGVGLAAVAIAQAAGATVFATAGSEEKRALLRSLGVDHVYGSRTLDFADQILADTKGAGVDVALNSLSGEFIPATLRVLRAGGVLLEIGKRGIWTPAEIARHDPTLAYHAIYLGEVYAREPELVGGMLAGLVQRIAAGKLARLPVRTVPLSHYQDAFTQMAQARHVGKIVLEPDRSADMLRADATYLITGGLGAIGSAVAADFVARGARHLVLCGRSDPDADVARRLDELRARGAEIIIRRLDVSSLAQVEELFADVAATLPPLGGIVHAAGVLDDGVIAQQDAARLARVGAPKIDGAWNLHLASRSLPLDFFLLFSAGATLLGLPGQSAYAAANAFLDTLAHARRAVGLPAISVSWGAWDEVGMMASMGSPARQRLADQGVLDFGTEAGLAAMHRALAHNAPQLAILPMDWPRYLAHFAQTGRPSLFTEFDTAEPRPTAPTAAAPQGSAAPSAAAATATGAASLVEAWRATPVGNRPRWVRDLVRDHVGRILRLPATRILDPQQPLIEIGFDSLMAVEMRNNLASALHVPLPTTLLFDYPTIASLVGYLGDRLAATHGDSMASAAGGKAQQAADAAEQPAPQPTQSPLTAPLSLDALAHLSDDEAEALLLAELDSLHKERQS